jgi:hypothetical protein
MSGLSDVYWQHKPACLAYLLIASGVDCDS